MDCDTTGIEPDFSLVKFKKLAGGGYFKIVNQSVERAWKPSATRPAQIQEILGTSSGRPPSRARPTSTAASLKAKGFTDEDVEKVEAQLDPRRGPAPGLLGLSSSARMPHAPRPEP